MINKIDTKDYFNFDFKKCEETIKFRNPNATVIPISALTGEGIDKVANYLINKIDGWRKN